MYRQKVMAELWRDFLREKKLTPGDMAMETFLTEWRK
jgi:hypothetical protein